MTLRGFVFSLEAAFSLATVFFAAACLQAFIPQREAAGEFLACSDAARVLVETHAFSSQETLQGAVDDAGGLLGMCVGAQGAGFAAASCNDGGKRGQTAGFSFPVWSGGRLQRALAWCYSPA